MTEKTSFIAQGQGRYSMILHANSMIWGVMGLLCLVVPHTINNLLMMEKLNQQSTLFMQFVGVFSCLVGASMYQIGKSENKQLQRIVTWYNVAANFALFVIMYCNADMYKPGRVFVQAVMTVILGLD